MMSEREERAIDVQPLIEISRSARSKEGFNIFDYIWLYKMPHLTQDQLSGFNRYKVRNVKLSRNFNLKKLNILNQNCYNHILYCFLTQYPSPQYAAIDTSPLSKYVMHPFWNWGVTVSTESKAQHHFLNKR